MSDQNRMLLFELFQLFRKHNATMDTCGCCDSPMIKLADGTKFGRVLIMRDRLEATVDGDRLALSDARGLREKTEDEWD